LSHPIDAAAACRNSGPLTAAPSATNPTNMQRTNPRTNHRPQKFRVINPPMPVSQIVSRKTNQQ
jgi:hypothetical protein